MKKRIFFLFFAVDDEVLDRLEKLIIIDPKKASKGFTEILREEGNCNNGRATFGAARADKMLGRDLDAMEKFCSIVDDDEEEGEIPLITFVQSAKECYEMSKNLAPQSETYIKAIRVSTYGSLMLLFRLT